MAAIDAATELPAETLSADALAGADVAAGDLTGEAMHLGQLQSALDTVNLQASSPASDLSMPLETLPLDVSSDGALAGEGALSELAIGDLPTAPTRVQTSGTVGEVVATDPQSSESVTVEAGARPGPTTDMAVTVESADVNPQAASQSAPSLEPTMRAGEGVTALPEVAAEPGAAPQLSTATVPDLTDAAVLRPDITQNLARNAQPGAEAEPLTQTGQTGSANTTSATSSASSGPSPTATPPATAPVSVPTSTAPGAQVSVALPLSPSGDPLPGGARAAGNWDQVVGQRLTQMLSHGPREAQIQLDPPELGRLGIRVALSGDEASVQFVTQHTAVRDLIESQAPRLREMLAEEGLNLTDVGVGAESEGGPGRDSDESAPGQFAGAPDRRATDPAVASEQNPARPAEPLDDGVINLLV